MTPLLPPRCRFASAALATLLALLLLAPAPTDAAAASAPSASASTNTIITCLQGAVWQPTNAVFVGSVKVFDPQLYLECDRLTVYFPSNSAAGALRTGGSASPGPGTSASTGGSSTAGAGPTPSLGAITSIVAQSNLLMMLRGATIIGDQATYSAENDLIHVIGEVVVIETESGYAYGTNFTFNRLTMELHSIGPSTLESKPGVSLMDNTNNSAFPGGRPRQGAPPKR